MSYDLNKFKSGKPRKAVTLFLKEKNESHENSISDNPNNKEINSVDKNEIEMANVDITNNANNGNVNNVRGGLLSDDNQIANTNSKFKKLQIKKSIFKSQEEKNRTIKPRGTIIQSERDVKLEEDISIIQAKKTFRQVLDSCLSLNKRKQNIQAIICIISLISSLLYITCTYYNDLFLYLNYIDYCVSFIFLIEYLVNFCLAIHRINFLLSTESIIDLVILLPPFFTFPVLSLSDQGFGLLDVINISRVIRIFRFFKLFTLYKSGENDVNKQIWMIINTLIILVLICSGILQIVEKTEVEKRISLAHDVLTRDGLKMRTAFHHYIYFIIVTISTVGYGDILPFTFAGQIIVMGLVLFTLVLIPKQTNDLIQLMSANSEYSRKKYTASHDLPHIILTGDISLESLKSFCQEFFHEDHGKQYRHAVIINSQLPSMEMELFLNEKGNENKIFYIEGDPMNEKDLLRADAGKARACIIFNNKNSYDSYSSDHQNLLLGLYIKKFVYNLNNDDDNFERTKLNGTSDPSFFSPNTNFRLCMQLIKPESKYHYFNALQNIYRKKMPPDQLILIEEIKMNLLSKSCISPGILALISNLLMSSSAPPHGSETEWLKEYAEGRGHEIYRIQLGDHYKNFTFLDLAREVYSIQHAIIFALEFEIDKTTVIKLNPGTTLPINIIISNMLNNHTKDNHQQGNFNSKNDNPNDNPSNVDEGYISGNNDKWMESRVKVFVYLICSDKAVADTLSNKEKDERKKSYFYNSVLNQNILPIQLDRIRQRLRENYDADSDNESTNSDNEQNNLLNGIEEDFEISSEDYFIKENSKNEYIIYDSMDIMQHTIKDSEEIIQHVVICGIHPALIHFILPLRAKYLGEENLKYIVVLAPYLPQYLYDSFTRFPRIIFIQGSPLLPENLYRANIMNADKAVILSMSESKIDKMIINNSSKNNCEDQMLDAESIFIYKAIKKCNKNIQVMTELICTNNIEYLLNKNYLNSNIFKEDMLPVYEFTPLFASGEVFTPSIIDRITCQSYFNPHILTILDKLLNGGTRGENRRRKKLEDDLKLQSSNLWVVRVPEALVNESFEELYKHLIISHKVVAIAIYRKNIIEDFYYVYTNPKKTTLMHEYDLVFVLGQYQNIIDLFEDRDEEYLKNNQQYKNTLNKLRDNEKNTNDENSDFDFKEKLISKRISKKDIKLSSLSNKGTMDTRNSKDKADNMSKEDLSPSMAKASLKRRESINKFTGTVFKNYGKDNSKKGISFDDKKEATSTKYIEIEKIKKRLEKIKMDVDKLNTSYYNLPRELESFIGKEIENELNVYLDKNVSS